MRVPIDLMLGGRSRWTRQKAPSAQLLNPSSKKESGKTEAAPASTLQSPESMTDENTQMRCINAFYSLLSFAATAAVIAALTALAGR